MPIEEKRDPFRAVITCKKCKEKEVFEVTNFVGAIADARVLAANKARTAGWKLQPEVCNECQ